HAAQGGDNDGLGFTTGEQGGTVGLRQHADGGVDSAHLVQGATVNATAFQHSITHYAVLDVVEQLGDMILARRTFCVSGKSFNGSSFQLANFGVTLLLVDDAVGFVQLRT